MKHDMDCDDCLERLYPYLDKELSAEEIGVVRRHLDDCRDCGRHFVFEELFIQKIRDVCAGDRAPATLREQIVLRLRR